MECIVVMFKWAFKIHFASKIMERERVNGPDSMCVRVATRAKQNRDKSSSMDREFFINSLDTFPALVSAKDVLIATMARKPKKGVVQKHFVNGSMLPALVICVTKLHPNMLQWDM
ncbi:hypothetical protein Tco_0915272 [Tanacetum coccineum]